jgi:phosphopantothenoylcysteine decarboxylase/phosphopantothenate--cysteine ligase
MMDPNEDAPSQTLPAEGGNKLSASVAANGKISSFGFETELTCNGTNSDNFRTHARYLDPVRFLTNGSSGRMGSALANQALLRGHDVVVVSGPVSIEYPTAAQVIRVESTQEMLNTCLAIFPDCDGVIAVAAPCDYGPKTTERHKISKSGGPLVLELIETPDIIARLGRSKRAGQWSVDCPETQNAFQRALETAAKHCDLIT